MNSSSLDKLLDYDHHSRAGIAILIALACGMTGWLTEEVLPLRAAFLSALLMGFGAALVSLGVYSRSSSLAYVSTKRVPQFKGPRTWSFELALGITALIFSIASAIYARSTELNLEANANILAKQLNNPTSDRQLRDTLLTLISQVQDARAARKPVDKAKLRIASKAVSNVLTREPQSAVAWRAAGELITFRSPQIGSIPDPCKSKVTLAAVLEYSYSNCTVMFDSQHLPAMDTTKNQIYSDGSPARTVLLLDHVHVIYRGGDVPKFDKIIFRNCTFDFSMPHVAPADAQSVTVQLLAAEDMKDVVVAGD